MAHKEAILAALAEQGVISGLKAQLRASVFAAINEEHGIPPRSSQLQWLLAFEEGASLAALVLDFLNWAGLQQTAQVYAAELGAEEDLATREELAAQLALAGKSDEPLLLTVMQAFLAGHHPPNSAPNHGMLPQSQEGTHLESSNTDYTPVASPRNITATRNLELAEIGVVSPTRKSMEDMKKALQAEGLLL